jgi:unspecific monooxygenase
MDLVGAIPFRPPVPAAPEVQMSFRTFLRAIRTNALTIFPQAAYEQPSTTRSLLGRLNITLNDPEAIHHVLVGNPGNFRRSPASIRILRPITGEGLLLSEGDAWKLQRRTIAPALAPRVMAMLAGHIVASTERLLADLATRTEPIDLLATMQRLALDIAGRSMFSLEMDRHGATMRAFMDEFGDRYSRPSLLDMMLPPSIPSPNDFGRRRFEKRWMNFIETILRSRLSEPQPETPRDLFDLLRAARDPETGVAFTASQLRDQVATLILAGHETTGVTLFWALLMLAEAQDEQDWLAEETTRVTITPGAIPALIRTKAVVNEALRLFPPAFVIVRETISRDRAGSIDLPPRAVVMIAPWILHRHQKLWDDPAAFRPARFMPDQPPPDRFAFMPFGAGPRICVGAQFAMAEAILVLAAIIGRFRVTRVDTRPVLPIAVVTTQPDHHARVRLTPR